MKEQESSSGAHNEALKDMFPGWSFIHRHFFEIAALAIPIIGVVGFAAGTSFIEGWNKAAGIGSNLFPVSVNETILLGLKLQRPWTYSGAVVVLVVAYLYLMEILTEWDRARWGSESHWLRWKRNKLAKSARTARKLAGLHERLTAPSNKAWKNLGPRKRWGRRASTVSLKSKRWQKFTIRAIALPLFFVAIGLTLLFNFLMKAFILDEARSEGVKAYVQLYVAITGKLPLNFYDELTQAKLQQFACDGYETVWEYRSVELAGDETAAAKQQAYIIHSTDKLLFLLDKNGSRLQSFGDTPFSLRESSHRPLSNWIKGCKQLGVQK